MTSIAGAVLLHPHPDYGGDQHNVVIEALWRACGDAGIEAVRFDFGSSDLARCSQQAVAALDDLPEEAPRFLVGYSFGAVVASTVDDERVAGWVLVAPAGAHGLAPIAPDGRPKLVLLPEHDQFGRPELDGWSATSVETIPGADHFLAGATSAVADRVVDWLRWQGGR
jgi:alpha/beta superfamily hydrolase